MTRLDDAHAAMQAAAGEGRAEDPARLRFYERLADAELFVLLDKEASGQDISPDLFEVEDGRFVLAFDMEERLAEFTGRAAPYAAMSGRILMQMLDGQGIGLGLNLGVAPSSILIPDAAVAWLNRTLGQVPDQVEARITGVHAPSGIPPALIDALTAKLASAAGLAQAAYLVGVRYVDGRHGHLLGFVAANPQAQDALAKAAGEALTFTGIEAGEMDVGFFAQDDGFVARLAASGICFELPQPATRQAAPRPAPGSDPNKPPILK